MSSSQTVESLGQELAKYEKKEKMWERERSNLLNQRNDLMNKNEEALSKLESANTQARSTIEFYRSENERLKMLCNEKDNTIAAQASEKQKVYETARKANARAESSRKEMRTMKQEKDKLIHAMETLEKREELGDCEKVCDTREALRITIEKLLEAISDDTQEPSVKDMSLKMLADKLEGAKSIIVKKNNTDSVVQISHEEAETTVDELPDGIKYGIERLLICLLDKDFKEWHFEGFVFVLKRFKQWNDKLCSVIHDCRPNKEAAKEFIAELKAKNIFQGESHIFVEKLERFFVHEYETCSAAVTLRTPTPRADQFRMRTPSSGQQNQVQDASPSRSSFKPASRRQSGGGSWQQQQQPNRGRSMSPYAGTPRRQSGDGSWSMSSQDAQSHPNEDARYNGRQGNMRNFRFRDSPQSARPDNSYCHYGPPSGDRRSRGGADVGYSYYGPQNADGWSNGDGRNKRQREN